MPLTSVAPVAVTVLPVPAFWLSKVTVRPLTSRVSPEIRPLSAPPVTGITAGSRAYDGTTATTLSGGALSGLVGSETLALSGGTGVFADRNVGTGKAVIVTGVGIADDTGLASNYTVTNPTGVTGSITQKVLTVTNVIAAGKTYDGASTATLTGGTLNGLVGSETVGLSGVTGAFADANAGIAKAITVTGATLADGSNGGLAGNYTVSNPTGLSADITRKALTVTGVTAASKTYDGSTAATLGGGALSGLIGSETLMLTGGSGTFADKNAGTAKQVTVSGIGLADGTGLASNYTVSNPTGVTGTITPKALTVIGALGVDKVYDGGLDATIVGASFDGLVGHEIIRGNNLSGTFADKNVGYRKTVTFTDAVLVDGPYGDLASNYTITPFTVTASIELKGLTVTGATAASKVYDGTTNATVTGAVLNGLVGTETLALGGMAGEFSDKNAGTGKAVTVSGATLQDGTGLASNYYVTNPSGLTADIGKATINAVTGITAGNKVYDGTTSASINTSGAAFAGLVAGDSLSATASGAFADKNAATAKTDAISGIALGGTDAGNYTLASSTASATADIAKASISAVSGITAGNKVYDGTTNASLNLAGAAFTGQVAGDALTLATPVTGAFSDKNAAMARPSRSAAWRWQAPMRATTSWRTVRPPPRPTSPRPRWRSRSTMPTKTRALPIRRSRPAIPAWWAAIRWRLK